MSPNKNKKNNQPQIKRDQAKEENYEIVDIKLSKAPPLSALEGLPEGEIIIYEELDFTTKETKKAIEVLINNRKKIKNDN